MLVVPLSLESIYADHDSVSVKQQFNKYSVIDVNYDCYVYNPVNFKFIRGIIGLLYAIHASANKLTFITHRGIIACGYYLEQQFD